MYLPSAILKVYYLQHTVVSLPSWLQKWTRKSGKCFHRFPNEEKIKKAWIVATKRKTGPQRGVSMYVEHTFLLLLAILACIHEDFNSMIWTYVFRFKLVLSFCIELGPWPLTGNHSNNPRNSHCTCLLCLQS